MIVYPRMHVTGTFDLSFLQLLGSPLLRGFFGVYIGENLILTSKSVTADCKVHEY